MPLNAATFFERLHRGAMVRSQYLEAYGVPCAQINAYTLYGCGSKKYEYLYLEYSIADPFIPTPSAPNGRINTLQDFMALANKPILQPMQSVDCSIMTAEEYFMQIAREWKQPFFADSNNVSVFLENDQAAEMPIGVRRYLLDQQEAMCVLLQDRIRRSIRNFVKDDEAERLLHMLKALRANLREYRRY